MNEMNVTKWRRIIPSIGKYPNKPFSGILQSWSPSENANGTKLLQINFEEGYVISIYGVGKLKIVENDEVLSSGSLSHFVESLEKLDVTSKLGYNGNDLIAFSTIPSLVGAKLWMKPLEEQRVGDESQTTKGVFWGTVDKYEIMETPALSPASRIINELQSEEDLYEQFKEILIDCASEPIKEGGIMQAIRKTQNHEALNKARKNLLTLLVNEKFLDFNEKDRTYRVT